MYTPIFNVLEILGKLVSARGSDVVYIDHGNCGRFARVWRSGRHQLEWLEALALLVSLIVVVQSVFHRTMGER